MRKKLLLLSATVLLAGCARVAFDPGLRAAVTEALRTPASREVVNANNEFGFRLLRKVAGGDRNVLISPASVAMALHMTYNGADGATRSAMQEAIALDGIALEAVYDANENLLALLRNLDAKVDLQVANALFAHEGVSFCEDFLGLCERSYSAPVESLDFGDAGAVEKINDWVDRNTNGRIPTIIDEIDPMTVLYLLNAIYFKGEWKDKFDKGDTRERDFHPAGGGTTRHPMMTQHGEFHHFEGEGVRGVELPYGDGRVAMYLFLPEEGTPPEELLRDMTAERWDEWMEGFFPGNGTVTIPRFRSEFEVSLEEALTALGMGPAFAEGAADFSGMSDEGPLWIGEALHKTYIDVNEEGTEAAAATAVGMEGADPGEPFEFVADRPFLYAIRDTETGCVLFLGILNDPR